MPPLMIIWLQWISLTSVVSNLSSGFMWRKLPFWGCRCSCFCIVRLMVFVSVIGNNSAEKSRLCIMLFSSRTRRIYFPNHGTDIKLVWFSRFFLFYKQDEITFWGSSLESVPLQSDYKKVQNKLIENLVWNISLLANGECSDSSSHQICYWPKAFFERSSWMFLFQLLLLAQTLNY